MARPPGLRSVQAAATLLCLGLAVTVVGTFLPWLRSGRTSRNSYASAAELRQFLQSRGATDTALGLWTYAAVVCALAMLLVIVGRPRAGAVLAMAAALVIGAVAVRVLSTVSHGSVRAEATGPGWAVAGAAITCTAAISCLILFRHAPRRLR